MCAYKVSMHTWYWVRLPCLPYRGVDTHEQTWICQTNVLHLFLLHMPAILLASMQRASHQQNMSRTADVFIPFVRCILLHGWSSFSGWKAVICNYEPSCEISISEWGEVSWKYPGRAWLVTNDIPKMMCAIADGFPILLVLYSSLIPIFSMAFTPL